MKNFKHWRVFLPLIIFIVLAVFLFKGLQLDPRHLPSVLRDKPVPQFILPGLKKFSENFSDDDLKNHVSLVNVWATWCAACKVEHPVLMDIAESKKVLIYGLNYKDSQTRALKWLSELGDPYVKSGFDRDGDVAIDWGVYGTPETFVVDRKGIIRYRHTGPITPKIWKETLWPLVQKLNRE